MGSREKDSLNATTPIRKSLPESPASYIYPVSWSWEGREGYIKKIEWNGSRVGSLDEQDCGEASGVLLTGRRGMLSPGSIQGDSPVSSSQQGLSGAHINVQP